MDIDYKLIGKRIQNERKKAKITQERLAEQLNVSVGYISQIERGFTKVNLNTLAQICSELNCDIAYIITGAVINGLDYLNDEVFLRFKNLTYQQKQMILGFIDVIEKNM